MQKTTTILIIILFILVFFSAEIQDFVGQTVQSKISLTFQVREGEQSIQPPSQKFSPKQAKQDYIVRVKEKTKQRDLEKRLKVKHNFKKVNISLIEATDLEIEDLQKDPEIESVELDQNIELFSSQTIPWGVSKVNAPNVWNKVTGKNIKIAIIDSGIKGHDDLVIKDGVSFIDNANYWDDESGHGTSIAGVIAAKNNDIGIVGVAPDSEIYSIKVIDSTGKLSTLLKGIEWSMQKNMDIIVLSLGVPEDSPSLRELVDKAYLNGILIVASSGKNNQLYYPAKYSSVIAVGSVNENNKLGSGNGAGEELEFVAPGENILSTNNQNGYSSFSGTSMAAPHVVGVAALLKENNPSIGVNELRAKLQRDAIDLGAEGKDYFFGYGLVNISIEKEDLGATVQIIFPEETNKTKKEELRINPIKVEIIKIEAEKEYIIQTLFYDGNQGTQNISVEAGQYRIKQYFEERVYTNDYNLSEGDLVVVPLHKVKIPVHQWISYQAKNIWSTSEINSYLPSSWSNTPSVLDNNRILHGARMEDDEIDNVKYAGCCPPTEGCHPYCMHFFDPDLAEGVGGLFACWDGFSEGVGCTRVWWDSAYKRSKELWNNYVIPNYNAGNKNGAYYWLGRVTHLLVDASVPAHVHKDIHLIESYENYMAEYNYDVLNDYNYKLWTSSGSPSPASSLSDLFYDMAEIADEFDSNDADGENPSHTQGHNDAWETQAGLYSWYDVSYAEARIHGNTLMPEAMRHVAGLYQLFWKSVDEDGDGLNNYYDSCYTEGNSNLPADTFCRDYYLASNGCHTYTNKPLGYVYDATERCSGDKNTFTYGLLGEFLAKGHCDGNGNDKFTYTSSIYDAGCDPDDDNDDIPDVNDDCPLTPGIIEYNGCPDTFPPNIIINAPTNQTYNISHIIVRVDISETAKWTKVSLDDDQNIIECLDCNNISGYFDILIQGTHNLKVSASDYSDNVAEEQVDFIIDWNDPPIIDSFSTSTDTTITEEETITFSISASDLENDELTYAWYLDSIDTQENLTEYPYIANYDSAGIHNVTVTVSDGISKVSKEWGLTVINVNRAPILNLLENINITENELVSVLINASDPDDDSLMFTFSSPLNNVGQWQTNYDSAGVYDVTVAVSDGKLIDSQNVTITVYNDLDKDGIPDYADSDIDGDGHENPIDFLTGSLNDITTKNIDCMNLTIDGSTNVMQLFTTSKFIQFKDCMENYTVVSFIFDFSVNKDLDLTKIYLEKEGVDSGRGHVLIKNIDELPSEETKTLYVHNIHLSEAVCIKDSEINSIDEITPGCNGPNEYMVPCDNTSYDNYVCENLGEFYKVTGLRYSGVIEYCSENWQCSDWSACVDGQQTRTCIDSNNCGTTVDKPTVVQDCVVVAPPAPGGGDGGGDGDYKRKENWQCNDWKPEICPITGILRRRCFDINKIGTEKDKPEERQNCTYKPTCSDGIQNQGEEGVDCGGPCEKSCEKVEEIKKEKVKSRFWTIVGFILGLIVFFFVCRLVVKRRKKKWAFFTFLRLF